MDYTRKYAPGFSGNVSSIVNRFFSRITRKRLPTTTELILKIEAEVLKQYTMKQSLHIPTENNNNITSISDIVNSSSSSSSSSMNACTNPSIKKTTTVITNTNKNSIEVTKIKVKNLIVERLLPKINSFIKDSSNDSQENKEIKSDILKVLQRFRTENLEKITKNAKKLNHSETEFLNLIDLIEDDVNKKMKRI